MSTTPAAASTTRVAALLGTLVALTVIGSSAVAVALPDLARELSLDTSGTAWVMATFSLAFSVTTALFGRLADLQGLRRPLYTGALLFSAGSLVAAAAPTFAVLVAGRLLQGAGAGAVPVLVLGIVAARYTGPARGAALGAITAVVSIVSGSGPLIGGSLATAVSWRAVLGLPALALLLAAPVARLAPDQPAGEGRVDVRGAVLVAATASAVTVLLQAPATGMGPLGIAATLAVSLVAGLALVLHVRARPRGLLPLRVVTDPRVVLRALAGLTVLAAYLAMLLGLPLLLAGEQGWSPLRIGVSLLPPAVTGALVSTRVNAVARRVRPDRLMALLALGSAAGVVLASALASAPAALIGGMFPVVAAFAGGQALLVDGISADVDPAVRGVALGVFNLLFFTGGAVGTAAVGGLSGLVALPTALGVVAVLPVLGAVAALAAGRRSGVGGGEAGQLRA